MLRSQFRKKNKVFNIYYEFLLEFLQYYYIREGKCEEDIDNKKECIEKIRNHFDSYLRRENSELDDYPPRDSYVIVCWKAIQKNLMPLLELDK
jgi:hypothetical protein